MWTKSNFDYLKTFFSKKGGLDIKQVNSTVQTKKKNSNDCTSCASTRVEIFKGSTWYF